MRPVAVNDWEESLRHVVSDMNGRPLNIHGLLANNPPLLDAWWKLRNYLVRGGDLDQRHCELVVLRVAARRRSWYEWASHVVRGLESGLSLEEIEQVRSDDAVWEEQDAVLLDAVDEILRVNHITLATLARLQKYFTNRQVLDLIHLQGMYATLACMLGTWQLELDEHVVRRLPDSVTAEEFAA